MSIPPFDPVPPVLDIRVADSLTEAGALRLKGIIERAWRRCGHTNVKAAVEKIVSSRGNYWAVRSNLVNGLPPNSS